MVGGASAVPIGAIPAGTSRKVPTIDVAARSVVTTTRVDRTRFLQRSRLAGSRVTRDHPRELSDSASHRAVDHPTRSLRACSPSVPFGPLDIHVARAISVVLTKINTVGKYLGTT